MHEDNCHDRGMSKALWVYTGGNVFEWTKPALILEVTFDLRITLELLGRERLSGQVEEEAFYGCTEVAYGEKHAPEILGFLVC